MKKSIITALIISLFLIVEHQSYAKPAEPQVKGGFKKCIGYKYNYIHGKIDSNSKEIFNISKYNEYGLKNEEDIYWQGKFSYTNKYLYDSSNHVIEKMRLSTNNINNFNIKYLYDSKGYNTSIYSYSNGDTIRYYQIIKFNDSGKEIEHSYYYSPGDSVNCIEYLKYNEKGLLVEKKFSSYRKIYRDIYDVFTYDSNNNLIEINSHQAPEPIGVENEISWIPDEIAGYLLNFSHPAKSFLEKTTYKYNIENNLIEKSTYKGKNTDILIYHYFYDGFHNIIKTYVVGVISGPLHEFIYVYFQ
jgi:hypothetical protein